MKCQHLNINGRRCKRQAVYVQGYHGDTEIYDFKRLGYVIVFVCGHHRTNDKVRFETTDGELYLKEPSP
jgi:hypothetical protein